MANLDIGKRVKLVERNVEGKIAYIGPVDTHPGNYYGVILDEAKGKNNGSYKGKTYFTCPDNHGIFVRRNQILGCNSENEPGGDDGYVLSYFYQRKISFINIGFLFFQSHFTRLNGEFCHQNRRSFSS